MSSFSPIDMDPEATDRPHPGPTADDTRFPGLADFREQAGLLAESGVDLIEPASTSSTRRWQR